MPYPFKQIFAVDESAPERVAQNGVVTIFEPGDPAQTPLTITSLEGMPLPNPIQVNAEGYGPAFMHATMPQVAWTGAGFSGTFESYEGMRDEAVAARQEAGAAASAALTVQARAEAGEFDGAEGPAGRPGERGLPGVNAIPAAEAVAAYVTTPGTPVSAALGATYALKPRSGARPVGQNEQFISVKDYGADGRGKVDDTGAIRAAVAEAKWTGNVLLWPSGGYMVTGNIPDLHKVRHEGNGYLIRDGVYWFPDPVSGRKNIWHVAPNGLATNDGLSPQTPMDVQTALNNLANYGPVLNGWWVIQHAAGTYPGGYSMPAIGGVRRAVEIRGVDMGGPRRTPTVIYERGTSNIAWGFIAAGIKINFYDIAFRNFDRYDHTKDGLTSGGVRLDANSESFLSNIHIDTADFGIYALTNTKYTLQGSIIQNCRYAALHELWHVTRAMSDDFASRNIIENCQYGLKAKELCTGHGDWNEYINNDYAVHLSRTCTVNTTGATFKRNKTCFVMNSGSSFVDLRLTMGTGADKNGVFCRWQGGTSRSIQENYLSAPYTGKTEKTLAYGRQKTELIGTTAETLLVSLGLLKAGDFTGEGSWIRWEAYGEARIAATAGGLRLRIGSTTGIFLPLPVGAYLWKFEGRIYLPADGDNARLDCVFTANGQPSQVLGVEKVHPFSETDYPLGLYGTLSATADRIIVNQATMYTSNL